MNLIESKIEDDIVIIKINANRLDPETSEIINEEFDLDSFIKEGFQKYVIDLSKVSFMSSTGMGMVLLWLVKSINRVSGESVIIATENVYDMLSTAGFTVFNLRDSLEDAKFYFQQK